MSKRLSYLQASLCTLDLISCSADLSLIGHPVNCLCVLLEIRTLGLCRSFSISLYPPPPPLHRPVPLHPNCPEAHLEHLLQRQINKNIYTNYCITSKYWLFFDCCMVNHRILNYKLKVHNWFVCKFTVLICNLLCSGSDEFLPPLPQIWFQSPVYPLQAYPLQSNYI